MSRDLTGALLGSVLGLLMPACPSTVPPPVSETRLAYDVEADLEANHCAPDGGLAALEDRRAKPDSGLDCLFTPTGSVASCHTPCPLP